MRGEESEVENESFRGCYNPNYVSFWCQSAEMRCFTKGENIIINREQIYVFVVRTENISFNKWLAALIYIKKLNLAIR